MTYKDFTMHQPDFLNDSDDSSDRKGYYHPNSHMSEHDSSMKRGGNNHFGSTGILKCLQCRRRKGKVCLRLQMSAEFGSVSTRTTTNLVVSAQTATSNVEPSIQQKEHTPTNSL
jgi:hypothetical protein